MYYESLLVSLQEKYHTGKWFRVGYEFTDLAMSL